LIKKGVLLTIFVFMGVLFLSITINPISNASSTSNNIYVEVKAADSVYGGYASSGCFCNDVL